MHVINYVSYIFQNFACNIDVLMGGRLTETCDGGPLMLSDMLRIDEVYIELRLQICACRYVGCGGR